MTTSAETPTSAATLKSRHLLGIAGLEVGDAEQMARSEHHATSGFCTITSSAPSISRRRTCTLSDVDVGMFFPT